MKMKSKGRRPVGFMPYGAPYGAGPRPLGVQPMAAPLMPLAPLTGALPTSAIPALAGGMEYGFRPPPFDRYLCDDVFPLGSIEADTALTQLLSRHEQLTPSTNEQTAIQNLVTRVSQILDKIVADPESFTPVAIEEVREVGSFKKGTMLAQHNVADIVTILKTLPTVESVNALGQKIVADLKEEQKGEVFGCVNRDFGCEIAGTQAVVRVLITIVPHNAALLEPDLHLSEKILQQNMSTIRHVRWFEEHATHSSVRVLVRLLKDVKNRFEGLKPINNWIIELLSHYCVMHTRTRTPLPLAAAFKRFFHVLSTGLLLPSSPALIDPCEPATRINYSLSYEEMDSICCTAQTLYRVILHDGSDQIIGTCQTSMNVATELSVWNDVVVSPLEKAYNSGDMEPFYGADATPSTSELVVAA